MGFFYNIGLGCLLRCPSILSKGVKTGQTATHFDLACAQTIPFFARFWSHTHGKQSYYRELWQASIIKVMQAEN